PAGGLGEAEGVDVEVAGDGRVADLQVDVADPRCGDLEAAGSLLGQVAAKVVVGVEGQRVHLDGRAVPAPLLPRAVPVQLNAVALRVGEVERLGDHVVG